MPVDYFFQLSKTRQRGLFNFLFPINLHNGIENEKHEEDGIEGPREVSKRHRESRTPSAFEKQRRRTLAFALVRFEKPRTVPLIPAIPLISCRTRRSFKAASEMAGGMWNARETGETTLLPSALIGARGDREAGQRYRGKGWRQSFPLLSQLPFPLPFTSTRPSSQ